MNVHDVIAFAAKYYLLLVSLFVFVGSLLCLTIFSGFLHGENKVLLILINFFLTCAALFVLSDPVKFLVLAIDRAWWPCQMPNHTVDRKATIHTRAHYLGLKIKALRHQLVATELHCSERTNVRYQSISNDLWLYGRYFLVLLCAVLATQDQLLFYNTGHLTKLFTTNMTRTWGLEKVHSHKDAFKFVASSIVAAFESQRNQTGNTLWVYGDHTNMLGVARLRQLRRKDNYHLGWGEHQFADIDYMPRWELPYERVFYTDKYWRIYEPWLPIQSTQSSTDRLLLTYEHEGYTQNYPELSGYMTLLARSYNNSMTVLDYLKSKSWLTPGTVMLFIDFTLYNVDSNIYSVITLKIERDPFGSVQGALDVNCQKFFNFQTFSFWVLLIYVFYVYMLIMFTKKFVTNFWYEPSRFIHSLWNLMDLMIILLNVAALIILLVLKSTVESLLRLVEGSSQLNFINFLLPTRMMHVAVIVEGFLVCLTTLRLWRVLQFASVFQMMTATLYAAFKPLVSTALLIIIFMVGYGMAVSIINGNYTRTFAGMAKSITSSLCFAFGFTKNISPKDLFHGGEPLGMVLYFILAFVIVILLMNLFATTVNDYFSKVKKKRDAIRSEKINFLQFLRVEYERYFRWFRKLPCFPRVYKRRNRTVGENIYNELEKEAISRKKGHQAISRAKKVDVHAEAEKVDFLNHKKYKERVERMYTVAALMLTQMELLDHLLFEQERKFVDIDLPEEEAEPEIRSRSSSVSATRLTTSLDKDKDE